MAGFEQAGQGRIVKSPSRQSFVKRQRACHDNRACSNLLLLRDPDENATTNRYCGSLIRDESSCNIERVTVTLTDEFASGKGPSIRYDNLSWIRLPCSIHVGNTIVGIVANAKFIQTLHNSSSPNASARWKYLTQIQLFHQPTPRLTQSDSSSPQIFASSRDCSACASSSAWPQY